MGKKWNELVSKIWKEDKTGSGITEKYHEGPVEYTRWFKSDWD